MSKNPYAEVYKVITGKEANMKNCNDVARAILMVKEELWEWYPAEMKLLEEAYNFKPAAIGRSLEQAACLPLPSGDFQLPTDSVSHKKPNIDQVYILIIKELWKVFS